MNPPRLLRTTGGHELELTEDLVVETAGGTLTASDVETIVLLYVGLGAPKLQLVEMAPRRWSVTSEAGREAIRRWLANQGPTTTRA